MGVATVAYAVPRLYLSRGGRGYSHHEWFGSSQNVSCFNNSHTVELNGQITAVSENDRQITFEANGKDYELFRCPSYLIQNDLVKTGDEILSRSLYSVVPHQYLI